MLGYGTVQYDMVKNALFAANVRFVFPSQLRYQHGLSTPDLRQTLPNLKNFLEHGLLVRW